MKLEDSSGEGVMNSVVDKSKMSFYTYPKPSGWKCYLFGNKPGGDGMIWEPSEGCVPNVFVRFLMKVCLGCKWQKEVK